MNTNRNTDQLFEHMRTAPVDIPLENVEKFVIAQAALGITAVGASKGIFTKAFLKFHLNSIIIMTTTLTAALVSVFVWTSDGDKVSAQNNSNPKHDFENTTQLLTPKTQENDTPKVKTVNAIANGENASVTTVQTETGTNIRIISNDKQTLVYYNTPNDSNYTFAYCSGNEPAIPPVPPMYSYNSYAALAPLAEIQPEVDVTLTAYCSKSCYDSLTSLIEKSLLKDGLISDTADYSFKINGTSLTVNGKKQNKESWRKYKEIIEKNSSYRIHHFFIFTQHGGSSSCAYTPMAPMEPMQPMAPIEPMLDIESNYNYNDTLLPTIERSLFKDGLITDTLHYTFKINGSYMKVNGEKMSKEQWKRYKEIIESSSMNKVNRTFSYAVSKDGNDVSISVTNYVN